MRSSIYCAPAVHSVSFSESIRCGALCYDYFRTWEELARQLLRDEGWELKIVSRNQRAFKITGLTWIVERRFAWLGRNWQRSEYSVHTSKTLIDIASIRLMLNRIVPA